MEKQQGLGHLLKVQMLQKWPMKMLIKEEIDLLYKLALYPKRFRKQRLSLKSLLPDVSVDQ